MRAIGSILVVVDLDDPKDPALRRAALIARGTGAGLHLLAFEASESDAETVAALARDLREQGHSVSVRLETQPLDHRHIINAQLAEGCGLVIKRHLPDSSLQRTLLTPEDWKLLRFCPCPVLLTKTTGDWHGANVLAAVDLDTVDDAHLALHAKIAEFGYDLADLIGGTLHVLNAHSVPTLEATDPNISPRTLETLYTAAREAFQDEYGLSAERLHVREGAAEALIPQVAHELHCAVCVLGSVARTGFTGVLMGNTAELVLDALESDVLVLKPDALAEHLEAIAPSL